MKFPTLLRPLLMVLSTWLLSTIACADNKAELPLASQAPSLYTGFEQLLDDDKTLVMEELIDLDANIRRVALYHNGDRLHRQIPKQVHLMIENKLMHRIMESGRFEVIQCIECRTTQVAMRADKLEISHAAESNQALRALAKHVRADAFIFWNASVHDDKFTINLRMVDGRNNQLLWLKEYSKKTTREQEEQGFDSANYEFTVGAWGIDGSRKNSVTNNSEEVNGVTVFGLRRRETTSLDDSLEYTLAVEYFRNFSNKDLFNVSGINLEGRIIADIPSMDKLIDTKVYLGIGQAFFNDANSLVFRFGFEFPFFSDGFMDFGVTYLPESDVQWEKKSGYEETGKFGGSSYDLTLGVRF
ncbi:hypothetical protein [Thalassolituus pacificus]|uniref:Uncharacterized protein n=1 Tax=Thalassolituus pacificus TaxID=2975440 RepID=A0A9X2WD38_9GAMM|nr:hypothetical protein [Thalassolituus pacificus]MCT7358209.1 hypothetical protein [Thalassolituus pacificus]